jgi:protein TonB
MALSGRVQQAFGVRAGLWACAAAVVIAVHAGCAALAMMTWTSEPPADDATGSMTIELELMPIAAPNDVPDVAHGELADESQAAQETVKETVEEIKTEAPSIDPTPPPPEPAVEVPRPAPVIEKEPEKEKPREERVASDHAAVASIATAPARVEAPKGAVPVPSKGTSSANVQQVRATWERALVSHVSRHKRYPSAARAARQQGSVNVRFTVDREGRVLATHIVSGSGVPLLDEEAAAVLRRASPLPRPPDAVTGATFDMTLPIRFRLRGN